MIGRLPNLMALDLTKFLKRPKHSGTVTVTGKRVNRGAGYGSELPCDTGTKSIRKIQQVKKTNQSWDLRYSSFRQHIRIQTAVISTKRFLAAPKCVIRVPTGN